MFSSSKLFFSGSKTPRYLYTWGYDYLGLDSFVGVINSPRKIGSKGDWVSVAASQGAYSTAVDSEGYLYGWGRVLGSNGSFGHNDTTTFDDMPSPVVVSNINTQGYDRGFAKVLGNKNRLAPGLAIGRNNKLFSFGSNVNGMSGTNHVYDNPQNCSPEQYKVSCITTNSPVQPVSLAQPVNNYKDFIKAESIPNITTNAVLAVSTDGQLYAWGSWVKMDRDNRLPSNGYYGLSSFDIIYPTRVGYYSEWSDISCGDDFFVVLNRKGMMYAGTFEFTSIQPEIGQQQFADPSLSCSTSSSNIGAIFYRIGSKSDWVSVSCGHKHALAIDSTGYLYSWGKNNKGQLGDGTLLNKIIPTRVGTKSDWRTIAAGEECSFAIDSSGLLYAWGNNSAFFEPVGSPQIEFKNILGTGSMDTYVLSPTSVGSMSGWRDISVGGQGGFTFVLATCSS